MNTIKPHTAVRMLIIVLVGLGAVGCSDPVKAPAAGPVDLLPPSAYPQIVASEGLEAALRFSPPIVDPSTDARPMLVTVAVRSIEDDYPIMIQYRFEFFDASRRPLRSNQGWAFQRLEPRLAYHLEANALERTAADWQLTVRSAR